MTHPMRPLILLRHGETDANVKAIVQGQSHVPLNEVGMEQARRLAGRMAEYRPRIGRLVSSDLRRAMQTAEAIGAATGLAVEPDPLWRERGLGVMEGRSFEELLAWRAATGEDTPEGGETREAMAERVLRAVEGTMARYGDQGAVAVVSHGGTIQLVLKLLAQGRLKLAAGQAVGITDVLNCSIMQLVESGGEWRVECVNDAGHLEGMPPPRGGPRAPSRSSHV